ncbi:MAG TPA: family 10 glycosylhydrolase, partial [Pyrinomonadaceae bacterium]|nr:family 10 glycosylhydrolase [Pyrinomonadaceae bacterium]
PYAENDAAGKKIDFPDEENWQKYLRTAAVMSQASGVRRIPLSRSDWRRSHVNTFIESVGREVKKIKPQIMYGISPFGIWQPMPERQIVGFNAYAELYADARKWLQDATVDYLAPQLYWPTGRPNLSFPVLLEWWKEQNTRNRHVWPGLATYRTDRPEYGADMLAGQIGFTRRDEPTRGAIHFSLKSLRNDLGGIQSKLRDTVYTRNALIPMSPWIKTRKLTSPRVGPSRIDGSYYRASWKPVKGAFQYVVYAKDKDAWSYSIVPATETSIALSAERKIDNLVVHAVDRLGNTSR